jgi:hypothetical protein
MKIVIVGVGALGSHVALLLREYAHRLVLVDGDRVEQKNAKSQFHAVSTAGKPKVLALASTLQHLFRVRVRASHAVFLRGDNAHTLLVGSDLVIDCTDHAEVRTRIKEMTAALLIPCLHGAFGANGDYGRVLWDADFVADGIEEGTPTCHDGAHLPFIGIVASYVARAAQEYLSTGRKLSWQVFSRGASVLS